ncbi:hypothetical protein F1559_001962 [Cyanidiococcus yangmingshanensis]|uniref:Uncharacterized protein n=1 Tax=Cyanidiococcus yangmingshanensis TaxID=2690220 RepID=A0A7J7IES3_9RHOD|nr:hypothetical protein F1559_001962 [Cyanidiococcus yangmingshanensis]
MKQQAAPRDAIECTNLVRPTPGGENAPWTELASTPPESRRVLRALLRTVDQSLVQLENWLKMAERGLPDSLETGTLYETLVKATHLETYFSALDYVSKTACDRSGGEIDERLNLSSSISNYREQFRTLQNTIERLVSPEGAPAAGTCFHGVAGQSSLTPQEASIAAALFEYSECFPLFQSEALKRSPDKPSNPAQLRRRRRPVALEQSWVDLPDWASVEDRQASRTLRRNTAELPDTIEVHRQLQDRCAEVLSETVARIRVEAENIHATVVSDNEVLGKMQQKSEGNLTVIRAQNRRLGIYVQDRVRSICSQWLLIVIAGLLWLVAFLAIRLG